MTLPFGNPQFAPPPPSKPSILDRLSARLFPAIGLFADPQDQQALQRQGLLQLSANLLQAGGPSPMQHGTLANIGAALGGVDTNELVKQALAMRQMRQQQAAQQAVAATFAANPGQPNEQPDDAYRRFISIINRLGPIPGTEGIVKELVAALPALKPPSGEESITKIEHVVDNQLGSPTIGMTGTLTLQGGKRLRFDPESAQGKYHIEKNSETGQTWYVPDTPGGGKPVPVGLNLGGRTTASSAQLMGDEARAAAQRLLTAEADGQSIEQSNSGAAQPSTWAAFLGGLTQKVAGERAGSGVTQALRGSATNNYQSAAGRWTDAYMQMLPKSRQGSVAMRDQIQRTYWGQEGDSPATVSAKAVARRAATAALARAVASGTPPALPGFGPEETPP